MFLEAIDSLFTLLNEFNIRKFFKFSFILNIYKILLTFTQDLSYKENKRKSTKPRKENFLFPCLHCPMYKSIRLSITNDFLTDGSEILGVSGIAHRYESFKLPND